MSENICFELQITPECAMIFSDIAMMFSDIIKPIIHRYNHAAKTTALYPLNAHGGSANYSAVMFIYIIIIHAPRNAYCFTAALYTVRLSPPARPPRYTADGAGFCFFLQATYPQKPLQPLLYNTYIYNILQYIII